MSKNILIILAAGKGKRMGGNIPKPMQEVGNYPIIGHILTNINIDSFDKIVIVSNPEHQNLAEFCTSFHEKIKICHQIERLGTGHAVSVALDYLIEDISNDNNSSNIEKYLDDKKITIICGDTPFIDYEEVNKLIKKKSHASLLAFETDKPFGYGRVINEGNYLSIIEEKDATEEQKNIKLCNSGVVCFSGTILKNYLPKIKNENNASEYYLTSIFSIIRDNNIEAEIAICEEEKILGVNDYKQLAAVERIFQARKAESLMNNFVKIIAPETCYFSFDTDIGANTTVEPYNIFKSNVKIGADCHIFSYCYIEDCEINDRAQIGPFARLRPKAEIKEDVKIGNFVEIKQSKISAGSKVSHLSYIGNCQIGINSNIGAGVITCNYDGYKKSETFIGDNVMVGSNSNLVAPIIIASNSYIAAGSTLSKNVPSFSLAIERNSEKHIENWVNKDKK